MSIINCGTCGDQVDLDYDQEKVKWIGESKESPVCLDCWEEMQNEQK